MIIITPLLAYAGFNTLQIKKDKKDEEIIPSASNGTVTG